MRELSKALLAAGALILAQQASAGVIVPSQPQPGPVPISQNNNGGLLVAAWNTTHSVVQWLGLTLDQIGIPDMAPEAGLTLDFGNIGGFSSLGASEPISYMVLAANWGPTADLTTIAGTSLSAPSVFNGGMQQAGQNINSFINVSINGPAGCNKANPCLATAPTDEQYAGKIGFGGDSAGLGAPLTALVGTPLNFYRLTGTSGPTFLPANPAEEYKNSTALGQWLLNQDGHLTWTIAGTVGAVPLPAAVWLLASGLIGFSAVGRRRKAA